MRATLPVKSGFVLWLCAPFLLWLSLYRPVPEFADRAQKLPMTVGEYSVVGDWEITESDVGLLGTSDVTWRHYADSSGRRFNVVVVFHEENWKSLHPPHICLEGSDMTIIEDGSADFELQGRKIPAGRVVTEIAGGKGQYLSMFVFVARDFITDSWRSFVLHHAPLALFRRSTSGFLLRVETWVGDDGAEVAQARCCDLMGKLLPIAEDLIE